MLTAAIIVLLIILLAIAGCVWGVSILRKLPGYRRRGSRSNYDGPSRRADDTKIDENKTE